MTLASFEKSALIIKGDLTCALFDKIIDASVALLRVTRSGLRRSEELYFPSLTVSLMEDGFMELSNSEKIVVTLLMSDLSRSIFLVPLGHSDRPYKTTLYFLDGQAFHWL